MSNLNIISNFIINFFEMFLSFFAFFLNTFELRLDSEFKKIISL
jgi:hypothetical protein